MKPQTHWTIALVILVLIAVYTLLGIISFMTQTQINPQETNSSMIYYAYFWLILIVISLILFAVKNKLGFYLTLLYAIYNILNGIYGFILVMTQLNLKEATNFFGDFVYLMLGLAVLSLITYVLLSYSTWKSKKVFGIEQILPFNVKVERKK